MNREVVFTDPTGQTVCKGDAVYDGFKDGLTVSHHQEGAQEGCVRMYRDGRETCEYCEYYKEHLYLNERDALAMRLKGITERLQTLAADTLATTQALVYVQGRMSKLDK
jgi:hypothetical protein